MVRDGIKLAGDIISTLTVTSHITSLGSLKFEVTCACFPLYQPHFFNSVKALSFTLHVT